MKAYELCDPEKRSTCKSPEEISEAMSFAYINVIDNEEQYHPEEKPGSEEQVLAFSKVNAYPMSKYLNVRIDNPMMIKVSEIEYTPSLWSVLSGNERL